MLTVLQIRIWTCLGVQTLVGSQERQDRQEDLMQVSAL